MIALSKVHKQVGHKICEFMYSANGVKILEEDWDTLILLDACRFDIFENVCDLDGNLSRKQSSGSTTRHFLTENFKDTTAHDTIYITSNPQVVNFEDEIDVFKLIGVFNESQHRPSDLIKKTLSTHRKYPNKRLIAHILPPHTPFLVKDGSEIEPDSPYRDFESAVDSGVSQETIREVYQQNVELALESIRPLIRELDGKTVISADHGELLGEGLSLGMRLLQPKYSVWEEYFDYGHYSYVNTPELIEVPWFECPHKNRREIVSESPEKSDLSTRDVGSQLRALGYK